MAIPNYLYRVDLRSSDDDVTRGVFYGSDEDIALSFCLQYTGIKKLSPKPEWNLTVYEVLMDDLDTSQETLIAILDQDGYMVPLPEVDVDELKSRIRNLIDLYGTSN
jgi:hypothetical protein